MFKLTVITALVVGVVSVLYAYGYLSPYVGVMINYLPSGIKVYISRYISLSNVPSNTEYVFTKDELGKYKGANGGKIYLAVLGQVFDVTKGRKHYGAGGGYEFFTGRDGTRAFVSGDFTEAGLIEDISGLTLADIRGLHDWLEFYNKDYTYVGKLQGHFYDKNGTPTEAVKEFNAKLVEAKREKDLTAADYRRFPPCNSESAQGKGRRLWCSNQSGGIKRDWVGVPREYLRPGTTRPRCACIKDFGPPSESSSTPTAHKNNGDLDNPNIKIYPGCDPKSFSCSFKD